VTLPELSRAWWALALLAMACTPRKMQGEAALDEPKLSELAMALSRRRSLVDASSAHFSNVPTPSRAAEAWGTSRGPPTPGGVRRSPVQTATRNADGSCSPSHWAGDRLECRRNLYSDMERLETTPAAKAAWEAAHGRGPAPEDVEPEFWGSPARLFAAEGESAFLTPRNPAAARGPSWVTAAFSPAPLTEQMEASERPEFQETDREAEQVQEGLRAMEQAVMERVLRSALGGWSAATREARSGPAQEPEFEEAAEEAPPMPQDAPAEVEADESSLSLVDIELHKRLAPTAEWLSDWQARLASARERHARRGVESTKLNLDALRSEGARLSSEVAAMAGELQRARFDIEVERAEFEKHAEGSVEAKLLQHIKKHMASGSTSLDPQEEQEAMPKESGEEAEIAETVSPRASHNGEDVEAEDNADTELVGPEADEDGSDVATVVEVPTEKPETPAHVDAFLPNGAETHRVREEGSDTTSTAWGCSCDAAPAPSCPSARSSAGSLGVGVGSLAGLPLAPASEATLKSKRDMDGLIEVPVQVVPRIMSRPIQVEQMKPLHASIERVQPLGSTTTLCRSIGVTSTAATLPVAVAAPSPGRKMALRAVSHVVVAETQTVIRRYTNLHYA